MSVLRQAQHERKFYSSVFPRPFDLSIQSFALSLSKGKAK
jgi:hypothetical protein